MRKSIISCLSLLACMAIVACSEGRDDVYNPLPDIEIKGLPNTVQTLYYGETLTIQPRVVYGKDSVADNFEYYWYKTNGNNMKLLSTAPTLTQKMDSLGLWGIYLKVVSKKDSLSTIDMVNVNVTSHTSRGWYVLKENKEGNSDVDLFVVNDKAQILPVNANLFAQRHTTLQGKPVNMIFTNNFRWKSPNSNSFTGNIPAIIPASTQGLAAIGVNDTSLLAKNDGMFFDKNDGTGLQISQTVISPNQAILANKQKAHFMPFGAQAYLPALKGSYELSPYMTISNVSNSYILGFDNAQQSFLFFKNYNADVQYFPDNYYTEGTNLKISPNHMNGTLSFMENTDYDLTNDTLTYNQGAYALFHENGRKDRSILFGLDLAQIDPSETNVGNAKYSPIMKADTLSYKDYPEIGNATLFTLHKSFPILYFAYGHKIGNYTINSTGQKYRKEILSFPSNERITYIHYMECIYDAASYNFSYFVVATYDEKKDSYKIYRYAIEGNSFKQIDSPMEGKGKVKSLLYICPSFSVNYMYRYY